MKHHHPPLPERPEGEEGRPVGPKTRYCGQPGSHFVQVGIQCDGMARVKSTRTCGPPSCTARGRLARGETGSPHPHLWLW